VRQMGPLLRDMHPIVPDNGYSNFLASFRKRCNYHSSKRASPAVVAGTLSLIDLLAPAPLPSFDWSETLFEEWISKFGPEKRARMFSAVEQFSGSSLKNYSEKEIFVKCEALLVGHKPNWAPRIIYKGTDVYNALSGPIFCELMQRLDHAYTYMQGPHRFKVAYKKTPDQYCDFFDVQDGDFIESDFSANDMKQCSDVMLLEIALMRRLGCPEWFVRLHSRTNHFQVKSTKHGLLAFIDNQLPTGATDTTFRNTFWNSAILYTFLLKIGASSSRALLLGDDMLARISGLPRYAVKIYEGVATSAQMDAKVFRRRYLADCTFLSRLFIPRSNGMHLTVPLLGKAIGRFNMRANRNLAVSDHAYMAGKSVGYAYEFRFLPFLRDMFLDRFVHEFSMVEREKVLGEGFDDGVTWNAKQAGITLRNVRDKLVVSDDFLIQYDDFLAFCHHRYGLLAMDVLAIFEDVVTSTDIVDVDGHVVEALAIDFM